MCIVSDNTTPAVGKLLSDTVNHPPRCRRGPCPECNGRGRVPDQVRRLTRWARQVLSYRPCPVCADDGPMPKIAEATDAD